MLVIKVKEKEYKIKYGYRALAKSGILKEVVGIQTRISDNGEENVTNIMDILPDVFDVLAKAVLAGLQKNNAEYKCDYDLPSDVQTKMEAVYDLLDDYMEEEESLPIMDLFSELVEELLNNGFLSKKTEELEANLTEQNATVVPMDHLKKN